MKTTCLWVSAAVVLLSATAFADRNGIYSVNASSGCNGCHFGGVTPSITLQLSKTQVVAGETIDCDVTVSNSNNGTGGFLLEASGGAMVNPGTGVKKLGSKATHSAPKTPDMSNNFVFHVQWTAPTVGGAVTFTAYGNATNGNLAESGDRGVKAPAQTVTVCATKYFPDMDGDGYGTGTGTVACTQPAGTANQGGDCDDSNASVNPNVFEVCGDGIDNDCNGVVDDPAMCGSGTDAGTDAGTGNDAGMPGNDAGTMGGNDAGNTGGGVDAGTGPDAGTGDEQNVGGCGCAATSDGAGALLALAAMAIFVSRRRAA